MSTPSGPPAKFNTLVVSDLHLGEDLSPSATEANTLHINIVEQQLVHFLRYYARRREDGRPWRLIINGDMVDFLAVGLFPDHPEFAEYKASFDERQFGIKRVPEAAVVKMRAVVDRHPETFKALARFVSRGNCIEIISGNHDTELHWPGVQRALVDGVVSGWESMPESRRQGAVGSDEIRDRIRFHPWFFHEPGVLWVEHGHQYDECCSFEHQLYPRCPDTDEIVTNVDSAGTRYITSYVPEADPHNTEGWSFLGYLRFGFGLGARKCWRLAKAYFVFSKVLLQVWRAGARRGQSGREIHAAHDDRRDRLARKWQLDPAVLRRLDGLRKRPIVAHLRRLSAILMVDKVFFYGMALLLSLASILAFDGIVALAAVFFAGVTATGLSFWSGRDRSVDPTRSMEITPPRILQEVDAKFVVFGHTHEPVARQFADGSWYYNTGTWIPTGKPGLLRAFTHLVVRHEEDGPKASLCQWRDGASRGFTPGWLPGTIAAASPEPAEDDVPLAVELEAAS
jgi:UDP-2,3-diacylglucosamine pyrophosphatase LpxH